MDNQPLVDEEEQRKTSKIKNKIQNKKKNIKEFVHKAYRGEVTHNRIYDKAINFIKVFIVASRKFMLDDCLTKASSTAYTIVVSFIPTLTVVLTISIFAGAKGKKDELFKTISSFMIEHNMKINIDPIFAAISGLVDNAASIGGIGAVIMIFSATAMLRSLDKSLNYIWKVKKMRTLVMKIIFYWAALTLGPIMLIAGTTVATKATEFFSSPDYNSAHISESNRMWIVGTKASISYSDNSSLKLKKIKNDAIDFDNQRIYKYDRNSRSFTPEETGKVEPVDFKSIRFRDIQFRGNTGWIVGGKGVILQTDNNGTTWSVRKWGSFKLNDIHMMDENNGFIASDDGIVLKTVDGGMAWEVLEWEGIISNFKKIIFHKNRGMITGSRGIIIETRDRGVTWELKQINIAKRKDKYVDLNNAFFVNEKNIIINASDGINLFSSDGGITWKLNKFKEIDYYTSYFFDENKGFVAGSKGSLIYTEDGGESWKTSKLETYKINKLLYSGNKLWAFGDTGLIQITKNNGKKWTGLEGKSFVAIMINFFAPFVFIWLLFAFTYMSLPNTKVPFKHASLGAAFTGAVWVIFILLFIFYIKSFAKGTFAVYGTLASIPLFLLIIYASTVIVLYGAEVSYTLMHPATYRNIHRTFKDKKDWYVYYGLALLHHIYKKFESGRGASTEKELVQTVGNNDEETEYFLSLLIEENYIIKNDQISYVPANTSKNVKLADVVDIIHNISLEMPSTTRTPGLRNYIKELFGNIAVSRNRVIGNLTLKDIIDNS